MGFLSFLGRLLFASFFILSAWQMYNEFGDYGGPAAKSFAPMVSDFCRLVKSKLNVAPAINAKDIVLFSLLSNGIGGLLFIFGSRFGANLLMSDRVLTIAQIWHGHYFNKDITQSSLKAIQTDFVLNFALFGALMYFIGMKNLILSKRTKRNLVRLKTA
ncbi:HR-like lesion-inducer [Heracleum sosnowskyi]|uniref:HR-like lesion-inducer n=1 Tax=Heracleum sosnowskyi TaxID=360622 RepID=A0AAD8MZQ4_9APIA|nr:HR-like lesion-inducer [Heracleum sosnowskyi]